MTLNPIDLGDIAAGAAALFALVAIFVSIRALRASEKSADAAMISAEANLRSAEADEAQVELTKKTHALQAELAEREAAGETPGRAVQWDVTRNGRHRLRVTNVGSATAHNVHLDGAIVSDFRDGNDVSPAAFFDVLETKTLGDARPLEVLWEDEVGGELQSWTYPG